MTDKPNPSAVKLGRLRWKGRSSIERSAHAKAMANARWTAYRAARDAQQAADDVPPRSEIGSCRVWILDRQPARFLGGQFSRARGRLHIQG